MTKKSFNVFPVVFWLLDTFPHENSTQDTRESRESDPIKDLVPRPLIQGLVSPRRLYFSVYNLLRSRRLYWPSILSSGTSPTSTRLPFCSSVNSVKGVHEQDDYVYVSYFDLLRIVCYRRLPKFFLRLADLKVVTNLQNLQTGNRSISPL